MHYDRQVIANRGVRATRIVPVFLRCYLHEVAPHQGLEEVRLRRFARIRQILLTNTPVKTSASFCQVIEHLHGRFKLALLHKMRLAPLAITRSAQI